MDERLRGRRLLLIAAIASAIAGAGAAGCEPQPAMAPVGVSRSEHGNDARAGDGGSAPVKSGASALGDFRATYTRLNRARFVSRGHLHDRFYVDVYANETAKDALTARAPLPVGALLAKDQYERVGGSERAAGVLAMQKNADGTWKFMIVDPRGQLVKEGAIEACVTCHSQAPNDSVFPFVE